MSFLGLLINECDNDGQVWHEIVIQANVVHPPELLDESHRLEAFSALSRVLKDLVILCFDKSSLFPVEGITMLLSICIVDLAHVPLINKLKFLANCLFHLAFKEGSRVHIVESDNYGKCDEFSDDINNTSQRRQVNNYQDLHDNSNDRLSKTHQKREEDIHGVNATFGSLLRFEIMDSAQIPFDVAWVIDNVFHEQQAITDVWFDVEVHHDGGKKSRDDDGVLVCWSKIELL